ncbi:ANTAR domain-containing protein [Mycobacterium shigaense]|uniref:ANTAR domain-containing protein n=1 Tax=Mycobacterium shigaense TaxID=722731 RepID=A0A1Z4EM52_9MYCO|nr:ANTAR domain-containing protein [Mycobacterium shigaense]PRI14784.1 hypothetical protein B2J96_15610 [Mycobacterium shigaense]BAX94018.1 ANTAR domain-containing protein [Mycobacterium shigaense]
MQPRADTQHRQDPRRTGQRSLGAAEGVLVALRHCTLDEAFIDIVETAKRHGVAPLELANALVAVAQNDESRDRDDAAIAAADQQWGTLFSRAMSYGGDRGHE